MCDICDASDPSKAHNASLLNDGGDGAGKSWWQSKGGEAAVTLELRLEQLARFAAFSVSFKSPRPAAAVLEKSADFGRVYVPYQYYSRNCSEFGLVDTWSVASVPGQLSCTSVYSDGENGMVSQWQFRRCLRLCLPTLFHNAYIPSSLDHFTFTFTPSSPSHRRSPTTSPPSLVPRTGSTRPT